MTSCVQKWCTTLDFKWLLQDQSNLAMILVISAALSSVRFSGSGSLRAEVRYRWACCVWPCCVAFVCYVPWAAKTTHKKAEVIFGDDHVAVFMYFCIFFGCFLCQITVTGNFLASWIMTVVRWKSRSPKAPWGATWGDGSFFLCWVSTHECYSYCMCWILLEYIYISTVCIIQSYICIYSIITLYIYIYEYIYLILYIRVMIRKHMLYCELERELQESTLSWNVRSV